MEAAAVFGASYIDNTLSMPFPAKGLRVHYGIMAILIANPALVISMAMINFQFRHMLATLPVIQNERRSIFVDLRPSVEALLIRKNNHKRVYWTMVTIGLAFWMTNIYQSYHPLHYFGTDVFDAAHHLWGFLAVKGLLFLSWVILFRLRHSQPYIFPMLPVGYQNSFLQTHQLDHYLSLTQINPTAYAIWPRFMPGC